LQPTHSKEPRLLPAASVTAKKSDRARWSEVRKRQVGAGSTVLRWQTPRTVKPAKSDPPAEHPAVRKPKATVSVLAWGHESDSGQTAHVRLTSQLGPVDPFDDPFEDRPRSAEQPAPHSYPTQTGIQPVLPTDEQPDSVLAPSNPAEDAPPIPQSNDPASPEQLTPPPPQEDAAPAPSDDLQPAPSTPEFSPLRPLKPSPPCDRVYNERNCCDEGDRCRRARIRVRENTIDKISLDISPSFKPDAENDAEVEQARALKLAQSAIRSWRNRSGKVIARGQVTNLSYGRVYIEHDGNVEKIPVGQLSDDDWCFLAAWWGVPTECSLGDDVYQPREWLATTMTWKASALCHKPLYFEEVQLERYGHTAGPVLQPVLSSAHFFLNIATLPYQMGINPPNECRYALGYYRPGDCAPWLLPPPRLSIRGGLLEAGAIVGGIFVIP